MTLKYHKYQQGVFRPLHPEKYISKQPCIYRSSYELKLFRWLDANSNVLEWSSESMAIPYISPKDNKIHRYFPDVILKLKDKFGNVHNYIVEVKPEKQTKPPILVNRKNAQKVFYEQLTFAINQSKWQSTQEWCQKNNFKFMILTEKELGI